jgi:adenylyltransferase/sulfurtransferase
MANEISQDEVFRYSRHLMIPEVGLEGQKKLKATSVLIIGAGGLGSPVALYLAAAGIGRIGLVDDDVVDTSNLQRQVMHDTLHEGALKVDSGKERLLALNPHLQVDAICDCFCGKTAEKIAAGYDILVDCSDNFSTRYLINDLCVFSKRPDVYGAIFRFEGQVAVFDSRFGPCYRCAFPEPPPPDLSPSCSEAGVFGVLPGVIGTLQATEVVKIALGIGKPLYGSILIYDGLEPSFQILKLAKSPACRICGINHSINQLEECERVCADEDMIKLGRDEMISAAELKMKLGSPQPPLLIDVRNPVEQQISRISGALSIPADQMNDRLKELDLRKEIIVFCRNGVRSARTVRLLKANGFTNVKNLVGGVNAWVKENEPGQFQY